MQLHDVVLYAHRKGRAADWLIALAGSRRFSHCSIVTDAQRRRAIAAREFRGVRRERTEVAHARAVSVAWRDPDAMQAWLHAQLGKPYDSIAWVRCLFGLRSRALANRYTCSALVMKALEMYGPPSLTAEREATPDDVARVLSVF